MAVNAADVYAPLRPSPAPVYAPPPFHASGPAEPQIVKKCNSRQPPRSQTETV